MTKFFCDACGGEFVPQLYAMAEDSFRRVIAIPLGAPSKEFYCDIAMRITYRAETEEGNPYYKPADLCNGCRGTAAREWADGVQG